MSETNLINLQPRIIDKPGTAMQQIIRGEVELQCLMAMERPRDLDLSIKRAGMMSLRTAEIAESCYYALPRRKKDKETGKWVDTFVYGGSIRLAEIVAQCWGNMRCGSRIIGVEAKEVVTEGVAWDLETNLLVSMQNRRNITYKSGDRYNDDLIQLTANASCSIAFRNAVFRVVGKPIVDELWGECRKLIAGDSRPISEDWAKCIKCWAKSGISEERVLAALGHSSVRDVSRDDLATLRGYFTALRDGEADIDTLFPPPAPEPGDTKVKFGPGKREPPPPKQTTREGDLEKLPKPQLQSIAETHKLDTKGTKKELAARIVEAENKEQIEAEYDRRRAEVTGNSGPDYEQRRQAERERMEERRKAEAQVFLRADEAEREITSEPAMPDRHTPEDTPPETHDEWRRRAMSQPSHTPDTGEALDTPEERASAEETREQITRGTFPIDPDPPPEIEPRHTYEQLPFDDNKPFGFKGQ